MPVDNLLARLWSLFKCLINNTLEQFQAELGELADQIMSSLEQSINAFFQTSTTT